MQSGADMPPPIGGSHITPESRNVIDFLCFWRRPHQALAYDHAVSSWGIERRAFDPQDRNRTFSTDIVLRRQSGTTCTLASLMGTITLILYVGTAMAQTPGLAGRLDRRASTLGPGVRLICVTTHAVRSLPEALVDIDGSLARIHGGLTTPALISLDHDGQIFEIQSDAEALLDWLWNDPRPHSRRA